MEANRRRYNNLGTSKKAKKEVAVQMVNSVKAYGGRFLDIVRGMGSYSDTYIEVTDEEARNKCSQRFREGNRRHADG